MRWRLYSKFMNAYLAISFGPMYSVVEEPWRATAWDEPPPRIRRFGVIWEAVQA